MTSQSLIDDFKRMIRNPSMLEQGLESWQQACSAHLQQLSADDARALIDELQELVRENRHLFEQESRTLLNSLVDRPTSARRAKVKSYRDIGDL